MSTYLVLSHTHYLLPLAYRLQQEGHEVYHTAWRARYDRAWSGVIPSLLPPGEEGRYHGRPNRAVLEPWQAREDVIVLTDAPEWGGLFPNAAYVNRSDTGTLGPVRVGGWCREGVCQFPYLMVYDLGAYPGGGGPACEAGLTIVRSLPVAFVEAFQKALPDNFSGLAQVGVTVRPDGGVEVTGARVGWYPLHLHAFLASLPDGGLTKVLEGVDQPIPMKEYTVVASVTVPPWPLVCNLNARSAPVTGLTPEQEGQMFWHDVGVDRRVAGLDGFVAVAWGAANSLDLARARCLQLGSSLVVPERQLRVDVGAGVAALLAHIEATLG